MLQVLAVDRVKQKWYLDVFRNALWSIAKGILWFLDGFFDVLNKIWRFKFFDGEYVNKIFSGALIVACSWLALKVVIELVMNYIVKNDERDSPLTIYRGIVIAIVMMFLITPLFQFGHKFSTKLTEAVVSVSGMGNGSSAENTISKALILSMIYQDEMDDSDKVYLLVNWKKVDINDTTGGFMGIGDYYKYSVNFFMLIVLSIVTIILFFLIAIQMAKRVMEIALYKIIGPFCCTGLTNNRSKTFETWIKNSMGLFLITTVQFVCIGLLLNMFGTAFTQNGIIAGIFLIIGALLFIIGTPSLISSLLGQQSGMMDATTGISLLAMGKLLQAGGSVAKAGVSSALGVGSNVANHVSGGVSNMFKNHSSSLKTAQMNNVKEALSRNNGYKASQMTKQYVNENLQKKGNYNLKNNFNVNGSNMKYNPIRNKYFNQANLQAKSNFDKKDS